MLTSFSSFLKNHSWFSPSLLHIDIKMIKERGLKGLVLDFDGVLAAADQIPLSENIQRWIEQCLINNIFLAVHSNNPPHLEKKRKKYLEEKYPAILWISTHPKKPSPVGIRIASSIWNCETALVAMVDDRLLTGGKAAQNAGAQFIYISEPLKDMGQCYWQERGCMIIRLIERILYKVPTKSW